MKDYWPGYAVAVLGIADQLLGGRSGLLFIGWGAGFLFATVVWRNKHRDQRLASLEAPGAPEGRYVVHTKREDYFIRTRVVGPDGRVVPLPWWLDCFTHRGAMRKARRTVRRMTKPPRVQWVGPMKDEP